MTDAQHHTKCAAEGCRTQIAKGWYCLPHWLAIPEALQTAVKDAFYAARRAHHRAPRDEQDRLNRAYGVAFRDCQDHLRKVPRTRVTDRAAVAHAADGRAVRFTGGRRL